MLFFFFFACFFLAIHPSIHSSSIHSTTYLPFFLIYLPGLQKMRLWLGLQRIDSLTVTFSHPKEPFYIIHVFLFSEFSINLTILHGNQYYLQHVHRFLASATEVGEDSSWFLCYRATSDGWSNRIVHQKFDHKRNTVTIIRKGSNVFGGYTDISWGKILC